MQIFVRYFENIETFDVSKEDTIEFVKKKLSQKYGINGEKVLLHNDGINLQNNVQIGDLSSFELDVTLLLIGGTVHVSLPHSGREQLPKVEKQEKKIMKIGRVEKKQQYNRRFINVIPVFGKRRKPSTQNYHKNVSPMLALAKLVSDRNQR